jgi:hypothetical protein
VPEQRYIIMPVETLFRMTPADYDSAEHNRWFSFTAGRLMEVLLFGQDGEPRGAGVTSLLTSLNQGLDAREAFSRSYPQLSMARLEALLQDLPRPAPGQSATMIAGMNCPLVFDVPPRARPRDETPLVTPVPDEAIARLQQKLRALARPDGYGRWIVAP